MEQYDDNSGTAIMKHGHDRSSTGITELGCDSDSDSKALSTMAVCVSRTAL